MKPTCATCAHYFHDADKGECHRMPPTPFLIKQPGGEPGAVSLFAPVDSTQWCGEWRSKTEKVWVVD